MKDKLYDRRIAPALDKLYGIAGNPFGINPTWSRMVEFATTNRCEIPWYAFHIDSTTLNDIVKEACKGLRSFWIWPWKIYYVYTDEQIKLKYDEIGRLMSDPDKNEFEIKYLQEEIEFNPTARDRNAQFDEYQADLQYLDERLERKEITRTEYNKEMKKLAKLYGLQRRSWDREKVSYNINNFAPNTSADMYTELADLYAKVPATPTGMSEDEFCKVLDTTNILDVYDECIRGTRAHDLYVMRAFENYMTSNVAK